MLNIVNNIFRYPIKGLNGESLDSITIKTGDVIPGDREYALARWNVEFDPNRPQYMKKTNFLALVSDAQLVKFRVELNPTSRILKIKEGNKLLLEVNLSNPENYDQVSELFAQKLGIPPANKPVLVTGKEGTKSHSFSDVPDRAISLISLSSLHELSERIGVRVDPIRFRGNIYFENNLPWEEFNWIHSYVRIGETLLWVFSAIKRCGATNVNPATGIRDLNIPKELVMNYGHMNMGVYAKVIKGGQINHGARVELI